MCMYTCMHAHPSIYPYMQTNRHTCNSYMNNGYRHAHTRTSTCNTCIHAWHCTHPYTYTSTPRFALAKGASGDLLRLYYWSMNWFVSSML